MSTCKTMTILFSVSVPVLSVQRTSMLPKFWIEFNRFTMTFFLDMATALFDKLTEMIIGSKSGVSPTDRATAKSRESTTVPALPPVAALCQALTRNTNPTSNTVTFNKNMPNLFVLLSNSVSGFFSIALMMIFPYSVIVPVFTTTAMPVPLKMEAPMNKQFVHLAMEDTSSGLMGSGDFSTGIDSPVIAD